jgi:hypothetical protein
MIPKEIDRLHISEQKNYLERIIVDTFQPGSLTAYVLNNS